MTVVVNQVTNPHRTVQRQVYYSGPNPAPVQASLLPLDGQIALHLDAADTVILLAAARHLANSIIVDLAEPVETQHLLIDALAAASHPPGIIVLCRPKDAEQYVQRAGVQAVVTLPLMPRQLREAVLRPPFPSPAPLPPAAANPPWLIRQPAAPDQGGTAI